MAQIAAISARWILDSRGLPTVLCEVAIDQNGRKGYGKASVPSGASTGSHEALELRDGEKDFHGKGVKKAVENIKTKISAGVSGKEFGHASEVDEFLLELDATENKTNLGANAILAVSMAAHRAFADLFALELWQYLRRLYFSDLPLKAIFPRLMCNIINGGEHADNNLNIQEFMIVPKMGNLEKDVQAASEIYHTLKKSLSEQNQPTALGDEGGFAPNFENTEEVLKIISESISKSGYQKNQCDLAMDAAANEFYDSKNGTYQVDGKTFNVEELTRFYQNLQSNYPIISIEDGFAEDDLKGWKQMTIKMAASTKLIGDDLFVTNTKRFMEIGIEKEIANGILIKLNQIGSVLETADVINKAKKHGYVTAVSHRSGETTDDFIADLAFAAQSEFIKLGAPARGERVAKFNRLLEIYETEEE